MYAAGHDISGRGMYMDAQLLWQQGTNGGSYSLSILDYPKNAT